jgi:hypothetical protein
MPTYTVQMRVNVPGIGNTTQSYPGIVAPDIEGAMKVAIQGVVIEVTGVQKTA